MDILEKQFSNIDRISSVNTKKVLDAFREFKVDEAMLHGTTGYGYDDRGREALDHIYAKVFDCEDAIVRHNFVNGTHTLATVFYAVLRPGDTLYSVTGNPYDTLMDSIESEGRGSLKDFGIKFRKQELGSDGKPDTELLRKTLEADKSIRMVFAQRSKGYTDRDTLTIEDIKMICDTVNSVDCDIPVYVDNCYGEFVCELEPTSVGASIMAGSLIKNPGGGIARTGGYIAGRKKYVDMCADRLTAVGIGRECGATLDEQSRMFQGFFMAPHTVAQALKTAVYAAFKLKELGFDVSPSPETVRSDIIQSVIFHDRQKLIDFCRGIQFSSPIDSFVTPEPWAMPGYHDEVIMAAGAFVSGSSIELSCDGPLREPYIGYMQGGLTFESGKIAIDNAIKEMGL